MEFLEVVGTWLARLGGPAVLAIAGAKWMLARAEKSLDSRLQLKLGEKLEQARGQNRLELESLKALEARVSGHLSIVTALESSAHSATLTRRIQAVDAIWKAMIFFKREFPAPILMLDVAREDEYAKARRSSETEEMLKGYTRVSLANEYFTHSEASVESHRPFVTELLWQYFHGYRAWIGRVLVRALDEDTALVPWYNDPRSCDLVKAILPAPDWSRILGLDIGRFSAVRTAIEALMLEEMRTMLSGETASKRALERLPEIRGAIAKVESG